LAPPDQDGPERALVWITRTRPGADETARRLRAAGLEPLLAPVLETVPLEAVLELAPDEDLVVTSLAGLERAASLSVRRDHAVYAVGDATAAAARAHGYARVVSAAGDGAALARLLLEEGSGAGLVHASGLEVAADLVGTVVARGRRARQVVVYKTEPLDRLPETVQRALEAGRLAAVLVHSPRGAAAVARLLGPASARPRAALGLSEACLGPLGTLGGLVRAAASAPTDAALIEAALDLIGRLDERG
jgi:uroporphyrinogen-III synthase